LKEGRKKGRKKKRNKEENEGMARRKLKETDIEIKE
jgi:hypothetical protein